MFFGLFGYLFWRFLFFFPILTIFQIFNFIFLPAVMDKGMEGGSADPYFKLYVDGEKIYESDKISNTLNPEWEEFSIDREVFGSTPKIVDIKMKVKDSDWGNSDDDMGKLYFKIHSHEGGIRAMRHVDLINDDDEACGEIYIDVDEN